MPSILGREVGPIGYGLMRHTNPQNLLSEEEAFESMRTAAEAGCILWNGGEFYGTPNYNSLVLLNRFFKKYPQYADKIVLNIKGAMQNYVPDGSPEGVRKSVLNSVKQLGGTIKIAMFECGRRDVKVPLKATLETLQSLVEENQIESIALSEVNAETIREASKIVKISAVEIELSLWCTDPLHNGIASACAELDIPILAYSPVGRGMLTGALQSVNDLDPEDFRRRFPRYQEGNFETNLKLAKALQALAERKGCTPSQLALGWLIAISKRTGMPAIIPIPGSTSAKHVQENAEVVNMNDDEMNEIDAILASNPVVGDRYPGSFMHMINL